MNTLNITKGKIKADLQAYTPKNLDADFKNIAKELDVAISETTNHLKTILMQMEQQFWKKVELHCKNKEKSKQATKKDLEDAIDEANCTFSVLNESALKSEDQQQAAYHAVKTRIDRILDSKHFGICIDGKTKDSLHRYLDKHPEKLQKLFSSHIKTTAGASTALSNLVKKSAQSAVDYYFQKDDHLYLKNFVKRVSMSVVQHHLATTASNMQEQQTHPPIFHCFLLSCSYACA